MQWTRGWAAAVRGAVLCVGLGLSALAQANLGVVDPTAARDYEVLKDALPDSLAPSDLEVVVLSRNATCVREEKRVMGVRVAWSNTDYDQTVCTQLIPLVMATAPETVLMQHQVQAEWPRSLQAALKQLNPAPQRRYVALVIWRMSPSRHFNGIEMEEAVWDRETNTWVWHAFRREEAWTRSEQGSFIEAAKTWTHMLHHDLIQAVTQRGVVRQMALVPGARWVAPADIRRWQPGAMAGLIFVNRDHKESANFTGPMRVAMVRRAEDPEVPFARAEFGSPHHQLRAQHTPALPNLTYAAIELPPGTYEIDFGGRHRVTLQAGERRVFSVEAQFLRMGDTLTHRDLDWFQSHLENWPRHAFLAHPRQTAPYFESP